MPLRKLVRTKNLGDRINVVLTDALPALGNDLHPLHFKLIADQIAVEPCNNC